MKKLLLVFASLSIISCQEDDTRKGCHENCTTLQGKFVTVNNQPLANIGVKFDYEYNPTIGSLLRRIASIKSDEQGDFVWNFYVDDDELSNANGYFRLNVNDTHLSSDFIPIADINGNDEVRIYNVQTRDTILNYNFYVPKKAFIKVHLNNFIPIAAGDFFEVQTYYPAGYEVSPGVYQTHGTFRDEPNTQQNQFYTDVVVSQGAENTIVIARRKNGVTTYEEFPVSVPVGTNNIELTFEY